ncbi:MAG: lysophospholipid acyltransferase family protein [Thermoguttaceae bacterium]
MRGAGVRDWLAYLIVRVAICVVEALKPEEGQGLARRLAWLMTHVVRLRRRVVEENLRHAFPGLSAAQRQRLVRRMWEHLFVLVYEVVHATRKVRETNWRRYARLNGLAPLVRLLLGNRPVVLVTAHFGNFEIAGYLMGLFGFPSFTVARTLDNPYLDRLISRFRRATGQSIIPKVGGYERIVEVLARGGTMAFLADQYAGAKGCWVEFFGRPASAHKAIALLSLEHDAPIAVCGALRRARPLQIELKLFGIADPREARAEAQSVGHLTQWYTSRLEQMIREAPEQYWWLHRRWKDPRPPHRRRTSKAA